MKNVQRTKHFVKTAICSATELKSYNYKQKKIRNISVIERKLKNNLLALYFYLKSETTMATEN
jgi:hypothetical protein